MKAGLVGPSYQMEGLSFDAQRTINMYPVISEAQGSKSISALFGTPGLALFAEAGNGPIRGTITAGNGRSFVVSWNKFYEVNSDGTTTLKGTLSSFNNPVSMDENGFQLMIATGSDGYIFVYATNEDIIVNGDFATDTIWTKGTGWTIGAGVATASGAISTALSQTPSPAIIEGVSYVVTYTITRSAGSITPNLGGTAGTTRSASGTYTETITAGSTSLFEFTTSGFTGTVDNVSVVQSNDAFIQITDPDYVDADFVTFQDGYFIVNRPDTGEFYISGLYNGFSWDPLEFATAETSPDRLVAPFSAYGQLWLFGETTIEVWYNSGETDFPYARIQGGKMETGCAARFSIAKADNSLFWIGQDEYGSGIVYKAQGYSPVRISTNAIELKLRAVADISALVGFCYQQDGDLFYIITGSDLETTLVMDVSTGLWHERAYLDSGNLTQWRGIFPFFAFGKNLIGDRDNGLIYEISPEVYTDNGDEILRKRIFTHLFDEGNRFKINQLVMNIQSGNGLISGQGSNPVMALRISRDGAKTWSSEYTAGMGAQGDYQKRVRWSRLGMSGNTGMMTFEVSSSEPIQQIWTEADFV